MKNTVTGIHQELFKKKLNHEINNALKAMNYKEADKETTAKRKKHIKAYVLQYLSELHNKDLEAKEIERIDNLEPSQNQIHKAFDKLMDSKVDHGDIEQAVKAYPDNKASLTKKVDK